MWAKEIRNKIILVELTVLWGEGCDEVGERKAAKYQAMVQQCRDKGCQAWLFPNKVGYRGFLAQSLWNKITAQGRVGT